MSGQTNSGIKEYFFGKNLDKKLTSQRFIKFQQNLQKEVMYLEVSSTNDVLVSNHTHAIMLYFVLKSVHLFFFLGGGGHGKGYTENTHNSG